MMEISTKITCFLVLTSLTHVYAKDDPVGPSIILPNTALNVNEGDAVELSCGVRGTYKRCLWKHESGAEVQVEDVKSEDNPYHRYGKPNNSTDNQCGITIKETMTGDEGTWTCKIMYRGGTLKQNLTLTIIDPASSREPKHIDLQDDSAITAGKDFQQDDSTETSPAEVTYPGDSNVSEKPEYDPTYDDNYDYADEHFANLPRNGKGGDSDETSTPTAEPEPEPEPEHSTTQGQHPTTTHYHHDNHTDHHPDPHTSYTVAPEEKHVTEKQVDPDGGSSALWISLIVIIVILVLLALCFWYFFCRTSQSHDIVQMEGSRDGVEMSPIVAENGDLETIAEEHSSSQLLADVKVEVHNEQDRDAERGKEEDVGISNKAFTDQEEIAKQVEEPESDHSTKIDQKDLIEDDEDDDKKEATNGDSEKNEDINDGKDSKSIDSISSEGERVEDKDVQAVCDENKDSDNKSDDVATGKQTDDVKDDDKANGDKAKDKNQDDSCSVKDIQDEAQESPTVPQQVEGEDSPFQDAVFLNMHNGEVYEEETKDKIDDADTKKE